MKLVSSQETESVKVGDMSEKTFGILANEKMFGILSSKIYSDKVKAPIRELMCNAYDAHVIVGKSNVPFFVQVPTRENPVFAVEDKGPGMDAYEIEELYTTYGFSSKTASNRFVGCLGLGSKSPFAYTDMFTIVSRKAGRQYNYQCMIENGMPKLIKFDEIDTTEPSGLRVEFNVQPGDIWKFQNTVAEISQPFKVRPETNLPHMQIQEYPEFVHGLSFGSASYNCVLMGNVLYHYNLSDFQNKTSGYEELSQRFKSVSVVIKANIGDIDISVSRETVEMTEKTIDFILKRYEDFTSKVLADFKKTEPEYKSHFDFLCAYGNFLRKRPYVSKMEFDQLVSKFKITFEGESDALYINRSSYKYTTTNRKTDKIKGSIPFEMKYYLNEVRFIFSEKLMSSQGINDWVLQSSDNYAIIFTSLVMKEALEKEGIKVWEKKDFIDPNKVKERRQQIKSQEGYYTISERLDSDYAYDNAGIFVDSFDESDAEELADADKVYYVRTRFKKVLYSEVQRLRKDLRQFFFRNFLPSVKDGMVIGVNEDRYKLIKDDPKFVNLIDYINGRFDVNAPEYLKIKDYNLTNKVKNNCDLLFHIKLERKFIDPKFHCILDIAEQFEKEGKELKKSEEELLYASCLDLTRDDEGESLIEQFKKHVQGLYPMMDWVHWGYNGYWNYSKKEVAKVQDYINIVNKIKENEK